MRILFYTWDEFTARDAIDAFRAASHEVKKIRYEWKNLAGDEKFERMLLDELEKKENGAPYYDFAFSFNFFPVVSIACEKCGVPYISLVFDSPFLPLTSVRIHNRCNYIYTFDRKQAQMMKEAGCERIFYSRLGVDADRIEALTKPLYDLPYEHDVTFLGNLYDNEFVFYDQIANLPDDLRGYFDGVIAAEQHVFGYDLIGDEDVISRDMILRMHEYVNFQRTDQYTMDENVVLRDMLRRKVTQLERPKLLADLAKYFKVDLYTNPKQKTPEGVTNCGYASYRDEMPRIFNRSKINLNFTMRTIISGIPLRVIDVLAAGGFLITTYQEEIAAQFTDGEELVIAYTPKDLREKVAYYMARDGEREQIALAGRKKALTQFAYQQVLAELIERSNINKS